MKIKWDISTSDVKKVKRIVQEQKNNPLVQNRIKNNLSAKKQRITKDVIFKRMLACLLSTQQRSGPQSPISKFLSTSPFLLEYNAVIQQKDIRNFVSKAITNFGGIRRANKIADEIAVNIDSLEKGLWNVVFQYAKKLQKESSVKLEREACLFIMDNFKGFGPKQSRNLWQSLGLTMYEIPIDSRITKWLNDFGFPIRLTAKGLSDSEYYNFISDGIQELCRKSKIEPCVLDAVIFSSFDKNNWEEEDFVW